MRARKLGKFMELDVNLKQAVINDKMRKLISCSIQTRRNLEENY